VNSEIISFHGCEN